MKIKKLSLLTGLTLAGLGYFQLVSQTDLNPFLKDYVVLVALQIAAFAYVGYFYWNQRSQP